LDNTKAALRNGATLLEQFEKKEGSYVSAAKELKSLHRTLQLEMLKQCQDGDLIKFKVAKKSV
jgi:hypothetical protein